LTKADTPEPRSRGDDDEARAPRESSEPVWLPDDATVVSEATFTSPSGRQYRVLRTTQMDAYDRLPDDQDTADAAMNSDEPTVRDQERAGSAGTGSVEPQRVRGAPFPHIDIPTDASDGRNADRRPRAPEGPHRGPHGPTTRKTRPEPNEP
jgi:hypothetical protein